MDDDYDLSDYMIDELQDIMAEELINSAESGEGNTEKE